MVAGVSLAAAVLFAALGQAGQVGTEASLAGLPAVLQNSENGQSSARAYDAYPAAFSFSAAFGTFGLESQTQARQVLVAILDTGIDAKHPDLAGKITGEKNFSASGNTEDRNGHGTHVAGIIAASRNSQAGVSGIAPNSRLLNVKVADDHGLCNESNVARAIVWAVDNGASVINVSLELRDPSYALEQAIDYAWDHGALVVAAAGNEGSSRPVYPAFYENALAVSATSAGQLAPLSNYGDWVDVAAPGYQTYSTLPDNGYGYESGTSFAAAHVSGLAALLFSMVTDTNGDGRLNDEVRSLIEGSALPAAALATVHGQIDFAGTLSLAAGMSN